MRRGTNMLWVTATASLALLFLARGRGGEPDTGIRRLRRIQGEEPGDGETKGDTRPVRAFWAILELPQRLLPPSVESRLFADLEKYVRLSGYTIEQLAGIRVLAGVSLPLVSVLALRFSPMGLALSLPLAVFGVMLPRLLSARNRARYFDSVRQALPHTADMLYAFILGGRNLDQAFRGAALSSPEPLRPLLARAVREMELGSSREDAFNHLLERCPVPELSSLLRSLLEAERRGHPLSTTLEVFSRDIRLRRRDQLRVVVAKAPLKMLAPLIFLILPASILLTVGPTFLATFNRVF
ncbi:MAG: type II secretion system F family protein [Actinobacteria bacterium]|nr:type II secretion system F family protein [Actinomycetota bacterium]MBU4392513.1 type II secretion system F family protein [Actinomycetota bacterium]MBU4403848.1 type II secretion system F family protein [Actinomycetota bacterium]MBU4442121.1 type II secretion system F family protein [Actinomycetota bacterium]